MEVKLPRRRMTPATVKTPGGLAQGGLSSMDSPNVALRPLLDHVAAGLAASYVEQMEEISSSNAPATMEQEERGE